jgi:hypothetical protein
MQAGVQDERVGIRGEEADARLNAGCMGVNECTRRIDDRMQSTARLAECRMRRQASGFDVVNRAQSTSMIQEWISMERGLKACAG